MSHRIQPNGRLIALEVLRRVRREGAYTNLALSASLERHRDLESAEKRLATELLYGVLRNQRRIDQALALHMRRPLERMDADTLDILRLAAYQILFLDRVPAYAAVHQAVETVRRLRGRELAGFANAVLRKLSPEDLQKGQGTTPSQRLAIEGSLPDALAEYWVAQLGLEEASQLAKALLERPPFTLRVNAVKAEVEQVKQALEKEGGRVLEGRWLPSALQVSGLLFPFESPSYTQGLWTVQDEAAQMAAIGLDPQPGERVLDACSGMGSKSTHLGALMRNQGQVVCADLHRSKLERLREHCRRLGITICHPLQCDLQEGGPLSRSLFDRVLVDAPCSGLGVLRRHPELKWRPGALDSLSRLVPLQRKILSTALDLLRPGGVLVYCVCTTTREEGPDQVQWLLTTSPELKPLPLTASPWASEGAGGTLQLWPHRHGTDGFFIARFVRSA
jgi:16S rRNA (cytosine967-C5)-methyltransferase